LPHLGQGRPFVVAPRRTIAPVSTGTVNESFAPIGSNLPDFDNYFCRDCRRIIHVRKGSPGFRACPTPGCKRLTGFGVYAAVPGTAQRRRSALTSRPHVVTPRGLAP
jgi:hypothetical protein